MARKIYDIEQFCKDVRQVMEDNLEAGIVAMNLEKDDNHKLIPPQAYIFQTMNSKVNNYKMCVYYYIDDISATAIDSATAAEVALDVVVIIPNAQGAGDDQVFKLLRYQRVLKQLFNSHFDSVKSNLKVKVESMVPIQFAIMNTSNYADAIGIKLTTSLV